MCSSTRKPPLSVHLPRAGFSFLPSTYFVPSCTVLPPASTDTLSLIPLLTQSHLHGAVYPRHALVAESYPFLSPPFSCRNPPCGPVDRTNKEQRIHTYLRGTCRPKSRTGPVLTISCLYSRGNFLPAVRSKNSPRPPPWVNLPGNPTTVSPAFLDPPETSSSTSGVRGRSSSLSRRQGTHDIDRVSAVFSQLLRIDTRDTHSRPRDG